MSFLFVSHFLFQWWNRTKKKRKQKLGSQEKTQSPQQNEGENSGKQMLFWALQINHNNKSFFLEPTEQQWFQLSACFLKRTFKWIFSYFQTELKQQMATQMWFPMWKAVPPFALEALHVTTNIYGHYNKPDRDGHYTGSSQTRSFIFMQLRCHFPLLVHKAHLTLQSTELFQVALSILVSWFFSLLLVYGGQNMSLDTPHIQQ